MDAPLDATERRLLGVLLEKALSTPEYYPLTVNALVTGANQKSNRHPVTALEDWEVEGTLQSLRNKGWTEPAEPGGRAVKWRHKADTRLGLRNPELAVLAELLLRGPQQPGELRGRAARMSDIPSPEALMEILARLAQLTPPLVARLARVPGERADRWGQTLGPETAAAPVPEEAPARTAPSPGLEERVARLEREVADLRSVVDQLRSAGSG